MGPQRSPCTPPPPPPPPMIHHELYQIVQWTLRNDLSDVVIYISSASQRRINILVSTHIFSGVRNPIKALFSALDHYNMLKHTKYTFQVVCHVLISENRQIEYISGNSQRRINILVSTHIFPVMRNPIKALFSVLDHYNMLKLTKYTFQMVRHMPGP